MRLNNMFLALLLMLISLSSCASSKGHHFTREKNLKRNLPFSEAVRVEDTLYLSGAIGIKPGAKSLVKGGIKAETRQSLLNIQEILKNYDLNLADIVRCQVMLKSMKDFTEFNDEYRKFFKAPYPARSTYGVSGLALGAKVEIECMASFALDAS